MYVQYTSVDHSNVHRRLGVSYEPIPRRKAHKETCSSSFGQMWGTMGGCVVTCEIQFCVAHCQLSCPDVMWEAPHPSYTWCRDQCPVRRWTLGVRWVSMGNEKLCLGLGARSQWHRHGHSPSLFQRWSQEPPHPCSGKSELAFWARLWHTPGSCLSIARWNLESHLPLQISFHVWEANLWASVLDQTIALKIIPRFPGKPVPGFLCSRVSTWIPTGIE